MKIQHISNQRISMGNTHKKVHNNQTQPVIHHAKASTSFAYQDYNISFGARLNRTPENFQDFNSNNMPVRMKNYLLEDFDTRKQIHPTELQKQAYEWLNAASSVEDIKETYSDEPLFADLKSVKNTKATRGLLYKLRYLELNTKEPIFKKEFNESNKEDLTVYLVKKIYLEGKTLKEINEDFKNEAKPYVNELLEGEKFTYADLNSLGVHFPKLAYWNSFQATRNDKDYNPSKRNGSYYKEFEKEASTIPHKRHEVSEETRKKLSETSTRWWASLSEEEFAEQVKKMLQGKEISKQIPKDSAFYRFQGPIQTIAMDKSGYSQRLAQIFSDRYNDEDFMEENQDFASRSKAIMTEFWNSDPKFRENYSISYKETMKVFEDAYEDKENPQRLEALLNKAVEVKRQVLENAQKRRNAKIQAQKEMERQAKELQKHNSYKPVVQPQKKSDEFDIHSPKDVKRRFRTIERGNLKIYPDMFQEELMKFLSDEKNIDFKTMQNIVMLNTIDGYKLLNLSREEEEKIYEKTQQKIADINDSFNFKNVLVTRTNDLIINNTLFELIHNPAVLGFERGDVYEFISHHNLTDEFLKRKDSINKEMKALAKPMSDKDARQFTLNIFLPFMKQILTSGFKHYDPLDERTMMILLSEIKRVFSQNPSEVKETIKFLSGFNASVKYINDKNNDDTAKSFVKEHMVLDYLNWFTKRHPQAFL